MEIKTNFGIACRITYRLARKWSIGCFRKLSAIFTLTRIRKTAFHFSKITEKSNQFIILNNSIQAICWFFRNTLFRSWCNIFFFKRIQKMGFFVFLNNLQPKRIYNYKIIYTAASYFFGKSLCRTLVIFTLTRVWKINFYVFTFFVYAQTSLQS